MKVIALLLFVALSAARSQSVLEGQLEGSDKTDLSGLTVHVKGPSSTANDFRGDIDLSGRFRVVGLKPGTYILQVVNSSGREIVSQTVEVGPTASPVSVVMPNTYKESSSSGTISIAALSHKPKPAAYKACVRAQKFSAAKDFTHAAMELEKAIALDPLYAPAHGNLGAQYARLARFASAESEPRRAIELDAGTGVYYSDLAWVLASEGQEREAQSQAQRGVDLDAVNPKAHLLLGYLLANHPETRASALPHLIFAAREIPQAHQILAGVYQATGNEILARQEMQRYLNAIGEPPKPAEHDEASAREPKNGH